MPTLLQSKVGDDQSVTFANNDAVNTQKSIQYSKPVNLVQEYELIVYNPSAVTDLTIKIFALETELSGLTREALITTVNIPKSKALTGTNINTYAKFVHGIFNGAECKAVISNDTALGAADGFTAVVRLREVL